MAAEGAWSEYFAAWIKSALRRASRKWPPIYMALANAPTKMMKAETKRPGVFKLMQHKQCASCAGWFPRNAVAVDHIEAVGGPGSTPGQLGQMSYRLFTDAGGLQVLCAYKLNDKRYSVRSCHNKKTHGDGPQNTHRVITGRTCYECGGTKETGHKDICTVYLNKFNKRKKK